MSRAPRTSACALLGAAAASLLAACGGSSSTAISDSASSVRAARGVPPIPRLVGPGKVIPSRAGPVKAREQAGTVDDEVNSSGAKTLDPCSLVSRAQAQAILGRPVSQPVDAPQGPTCIYRAQGARSFVTLAVQSAHFSTIQPQAQLRDRISIPVAGHTAYCGVAGGAPTTIVPLAARRFLAVTAPCPIGAGFAAKAVPRLNKT